MQLHRRKIWHFIFPHSPVFYLHLLYHNGLTDHYLFDNGFLAQCKKIHPKPQNGLGSLIVYKLSILSCKNFYCETE
jgi:hypothetical protein